MGCVGLVWSALPSRIEKLKTDIWDCIDSYVLVDGKMNEKGEQEFVFKRTKCKGDCRKCGKYGRKASDCCSKEGDTGKIKELT